MGIYSANHRMGYYYVLMATFMFAFKGILAKFVYAESVSVHALLFYRFSLALPLFLVFGLWLRKKKAESLPGRKLIILGVISGFLFFISASCDFWAIRLMEVSIQRMLLFTYPIFILFINLMTRSEGVERRFFVLLACMVVGVALVLNIYEQDWSSLSWMGVILTGITAINYALYMIFSQRAKRHGPAIDFSLISFVTASLCFLFTYPLYGTNSALVVSPKALSLILVLVVFSTVFPFYLMTEGIQRLGSSLTGIMTMLGPGITIVGAMVLLGEHLNGWQWMGVLVLYSTVSYVKFGSFSWLRPVRRAILNRKLYKRRQT